ncbi:MAG: hypothetical protein MJH10_18025 [Epibacterium sp.]|nr:hypothetical protein [Epibacterium sp.]NQX75391.1 hypothetical protein [Epibacterium sp.]
MLTKETVRDALETIGNKFFTVEFVAGDGGIRKYNGRINIKKGLKNNERSEIVRKAFQANGVVPIKIDGEKFKAFKLDRVVSIKGAGQEWLA